MCIAANVPMVLFKAESFMLDEVTNGKMMIANEARINVALNLMVTLLTTRHDK